MKHKKRDKILKKAFAIWEAEGQPHGQDMEHWLKAELVIAEEEKQAKAAGKKAPAKKGPTKKGPLKKAAAKKAPAEKAPKKTPQKTAAKKSVKDTAVQPETSAKRKAPAKPSA